MTRPVAARKATTQKRNNKAGIIGEQVYLSYARCNAKGGTFLLLGNRRADARQPRLVANGGVAVDNSPLGRFVDGGDEGGDVAGLSLGISAAFAQGANSTHDLTIAQGTALGLARTFSSGFGI